jgi:hypothetical protein
MTVLLGSIKKTNMAFKTKSAQKVLRLLDQDYQFAEAVRMVMQSDKKSKAKILKELEQFI